MSINYNAYHMNSHPSKRIRKELEKFHNTLPKREDLSFNLNSSTLPLNFIDWNDLQAAEYSENSTTPCFFCQFSSNQACIVKGISNTVEQVFTTSLQQILNIHTLKLRLVQFKQSEFSLMINNLQRVAIGDKYLENAIEKELDRPFILVQEFVPGGYFLQMGKSRSERCFAVDPVLGYRRLREIGEMIAADIFINNVYRVPVLSNDEGNPNTFLVSINNPDFTEDQFLDPSIPPTFGNIFSLDSNFTPIQDPQLRSQYLEKVERFVRGTIRDLDDALQGKTFGLLNLATMESTKEFFHKCTRVELDNHQLFQILKGIMGTFKEIAEMGTEEIEDIFQEIKFMPDEDWMELWQQGVSNINLEFLFSVQSTIKQIVDLNKDSFSWVYQMYKIDESPLYF